MMYIDWSVPLCMGIFSYALACRRLVELPVWFFGTVFKSSRLSFCRYCSRRCFTVAVSLLSVIVAFWMQKKPETKKRSFLVSLFASFGFLVSFYSRIKRAWVSSFIHRPFARLPLTSLALTHSLSINPRSQSTINQPHHPTQKLEQHNQPTKRHTSSIPICQVPRYLCFQISTPT